MTNVTAPATGSVFGTRTITATGYPYSIPGTVVGGAFTEISAAAPMPVSLADYTTSATLNQTLTTGAGSALVVQPNGYAGGAFDIGALTNGAVVVFEQLATATSATWDTLSVIPLGGGAQVGLTAAAGRFEFIAAGAYQMRARIGTAGAAGTVVVSVQLTSGQKLMRVFNTNAANLLATVTPVDAPNMAVGQITVATTVNGTLIVAARPGRKQLIIITEGTMAVRMGPFGVTTGTGILLPGTANTGFTLPGYTGAIYGITASGTEAVSFIETY